MNRRTNGRYTATDYTGAILLSITVAIGAYLQNADRITAYFEPEMVSPYVASYFEPTKEQFLDEGWIEQGSEPVKAPKQAVKSEVEAYIIEKFGSEADNAFKVLSCENKKLNPLATNHNRNGSIDKGVFQINNIHEKGKAKGKNLFDYKQNIDVAYKIFTEQGWSPWTCSHKVGVKSFWEK